MYKYKYKVLSNNSWISGYISANNKIEAIQTVRRMFEKVIYVQRCWFGWFTSPEIVIDWFNTLSLLMKEGIKIEDALQIMSGYKSHEFSKNLLDLIRSGKSFQDCIGLYQFFFDQQSIMMVRSLSKILSIESTCDFVAEYKKKTYEKYASIKKSLSQPCITLGMILLICLGLILFLKEPIESVLTDMNAPIPAAIRFINSLNLTKIILYSSAIVAILALLLKKFKDLPLIRECFIDRDLFIAFYFIGYSLKNGLSIIEAIEVSIPAMTTRSTINILNNIKNEIIQGSSVFHTIQNTKISKVYINIIRINEISGNIAHGFISASEAADKSFTKRLSYFEKSVGPMVAIVTSGLVLIFLNSFIFPIYSCITSSFA